MTEDLSAYLREIGVRSKYLHSDIETIERVEILRGLRRGDFDVLIGINLLREGIDLVEVSLVAILDADKEGFLRSTRSLIQIMGRAARNIKGRAILYADKMTDSIRQAIKETERRRNIQSEFNAKNNITPHSVKSEMKSSLLGEFDIDLTAQKLSALNLATEIPKDRNGQLALLEKLKAEMFDAASKKEFERAASLRDAINEIQMELLKV